VDVEGIFLLGLAINFTDPKGGGTGIFFIYFDREKL
jgi:hypothetical protein